MDERMSHGIRIVRGTWRFREREAMMSMGIVIETRERGKVACRIFL